MEVKKVPVSIYAEITPNPAVMKFVANQLLIEQDSVEFKNIDEAKPSPLAQKLFHFPFVKEVFISGNYIAISKYDIAEWQDVTLELRNFISEWLQEGKPVLTEKVATHSGSEEDAPVMTSVAQEVDPTNLSEVEKRIVEILDEYVRPAVEQDGGNIRFVSYEDKTVKVLLQGACSGCPSSTMTLKQGIQNLMQKMLPTLVDDIEAING
ncbi:MAG: NifU family protein [Bacteroidota bacterium]|nr:NifU family protein [Bacteroidota bacterium]